MTDRRHRPATSADSGSFSSPPCLLHELDPSQGGLPSAPDPVQARDVARWRRAERVRLLDARASLPVADRVAAAAAIAAHLDGLLGDVAGKVVSAYWPIRSELDLRPWLLSLTRRGATAVLPVVVEKAAPLRFRSWHAATRMERGFWNIPVPAEGDWRVPDILIAPVVGHDPGGFPLGYGGGYFDRTLAAIGSGAWAIGIGLAAARIATIFPQPHDIAMRAIVTEAGVLKPEAC
jgi:5,10-methenyltetrahydrofolate synthetase